VYVGSFAFCGGVGDGADGVESAFRGRYYSQ
jgi:hypothetical protein